MVVWVFRVSEFDLLVYVDMFVFDMYDFGM